MCACAVDAIKDASVPVRHVSSLEHADAARQGGGSGGDTAPRLGPLRGDRYKPRVLLHGALTPNPGTAAALFGHQNLQGWSYSTPALSRLGEQHRRGQRR